MATVTIHSDFVAKDKHHKNLVFLSPESFVIIHTPPCSQSHLPKVNLKGHSSVYITSLASFQLGIKPKVFVGVSQAGSNWKTETT